MTGHGIRKAAAMVGGAAALALTIAVGGVAAVDSVTASAPAPASVNGTPALPSTPPAATNGTGVHTAVLTNCVVVPGGC
ncbi:hypothetical protein [Mycobacterium sp.]|uniref:hypothetical protein n=1 Tax=Mycobacterium sp. TaxID=1785 RepID=UPI002CF6BE8D|nr:hypothetical protein [Mycobacterium sp.]HTQ18279.1 hypothetical protein [Mycobacterium sp.]